MEDGVRTEEAGPEQRDNARRLAAWLALAVIIVVIILLLLLTYRPPEQRAFITRNIECLRCHADQLPPRDDVSTHQPFIAKHCTSCHTPHGYERTATFKPGEFGPKWLRVRFEQLGLRAIWDVLLLIRWGHNREGGAGTQTTKVKDQASHLTQPVEELCWTCHGNLQAETMKTFPHRPFIEGRCTSCHDPHWTDYTPLLRVSKTDLCVACHRVGPERLLADQHLPFWNLQCLSCHEPHASDHGGLLTASQRDLCFGCHPKTAEQIGWAVLHDPFGNGQCTGCHRPHSSSFLPLLGSPEPDLCYGCHGGVRGQFLTASHHPVPSRILCSDCHSPHAAPVKKLLPMAERQLCFSCHPAVRKELGLPTVHVAFKKLDCTDCHVPHGSRYTPLLQASDPALCRKCHPEIPAKPLRVGPPVPRVPAAPWMDVVRMGPGKVPVGVRPAGLPDPVVDPGPATPKSKGTSHRVKRCGDCHRPHASVYNRLLKASGTVLCLRCHAATASQMGASAHAALSCERCHTPHNAKSVDLLKRNRYATCTKCHTGMRDPGTDHPVGLRYYDYIAKGPVTCASTCHDPHGSSNFRMLRVPYGTDGKGKDYVCLLCHTRVGITY